MILCSIYQSSNLLLKISVKLKCLIHVHMTRMQFNYLSYFSDSAVIVETDNLIRQNNKLMM